MLLVRFSKEENDGKFQSSPGPKAGCYPAQAQTPATEERFQSSPGPKAGCYLQVAQLITVSTGFNPHPARRPDAITVPSPRHLPRTGFNPHPARRPDATFTRPARETLFHVFQSSPGPKAGCYTVESALVKIFRSVSILTRPEGRMLRDACGLEMDRDEFQSSPGPKAGCYDSALLNLRQLTSFNPHPARRPDATWLPVATQVRCWVSILTRPEGRMLPGNTELDYAHFGVSILTRPEGRMLRLPARHGKHCFTCFNPHPARRPDATKSPAGAMSRPCCFNPHPARRPDATTSPGVNVPTSMLFQSSPGPKAGCYSVARKNRRVIWSFQSSPGPKAGCYGRPVQRPNLLEYVSILTRPEGRMLFPGPAQNAPALDVSILTRPEGRMLYAISELMRQKQRFNPHPARRPDAIGTIPAGPFALDPFQSSPGPKAGCYPLSGTVTGMNQMFQSSPGPKAGCYVCDLTRMG